MNIAALDVTIKAVAPIHGVSVRDPDDRSTWRIHFADEATVEQRTAAQAALEAWVDGPTADDVRAEAQRRIVALTGATSFDACLVKQLNAAMRAIELTNKQARGYPLSNSEATEAAALQALADGVKAIRAASNAMEGAPPTDYADDAHWPA